MFGLGLAVRVEVVSEVLQQGHFFLQFTFRRIIAESVRSDGVCLVSLLLLDILEILTISVHNDFGGVIEVHSRRPIRKQVPQAVLGRIIHPLLYVDFSTLILLGQLLLLGDWLHILADLA